LKQTTNQSYMSESVGLVRRVFNGICDCVPSTVWYGSVVLLVVGVLVLLSRWSDQSSGGYHHAFSRRVKDMIDQVSQLNTQAQQDSSPTLQLIHCTQALSIAQLARELVGDTDVEALTGVNMSELMAYLKTCQNYSMKNIGQLCPKIRVEGIYT
jgi:hypothetical protein